MSSSFKLSFIIVTRNKLEYLQQAVERLLLNAQPDEELIVVDGGSTDGTVEYLSGLYEAGRLHQFVSEPDRGEAHGCNKGLLMARGELIKLLSDDDAFDFQTIRLCREWMLANPQTVAAFAETGLIHQENLGSVHFYDDAKANFEKWTRTGEPDWLIGLTMMLRRSHLAFTGLLKTGIVQVDTEFAMRLFALQADIVWCTGLGAIRIENQYSNFRKMKADEQARSEYEKILFFYNTTLRLNWRAYTFRNSAFLELFKRPVRPLYQRGLRLLGKELPQTNRGFATLQPVGKSGSVKEAFEVCDAFFESYRAQSPAPVFLTKQK